MKLLIALAAALLVAGGAFAGCNDATAEKPPTATTAKAEQPFPPEQPGT